MAAERGDSSYRVEGWLARSEERRLARSSRASPVESCGSPNLWITEPVDHRTCGSPNLGGQARSEELQCQHGVSHLQKNICKIFSREKTNVYLQRKVVTPRLLGDTLKRIQEQEQKGRSTGLQV